MRNYLNKTIWIIGTLTIAVFLYSTSFFLVSGYIVYPFEKESMTKEHFIRPVYNVIYYPLRWFTANGASFKKESIKIRYGWLDKPLFERDEIDIRSASLKTFDDSMVSIGFTGESGLLLSFDKVKYGKYLKMTFGLALADDGDRFINRLISYDMVNLVEDPRIYSENITSEENEKIMHKYNNLENTNKVCAKDFIENYQDKVMKHCLQAGYAADIGGGCYHIVGYSINSGVLKKALTVCQINI